MSTVGKRSLWCQFCGKPQGPHTCVDWSKIDPPSVSVQAQTSPATVELVGRLEVELTRARERIRELEGVAGGAVPVLKGVDAEKLVRTNLELRNQIRRLESKNAQHETYAEWLKNQLEEQSAALEEAQTEADMLSKALAEGKKRPVSPDDALAALDAARAWEQQVLRRQRALSLQVWMWTAVTLAGVGTAVFLHPAYVLIAFTALVFAGFTRKDWRKHSAQQYTAHADVMRAESQYFLALDWWAASGGDEKKGG